MYQDNRLDVSRGCRTLISKDSNKPWVSRTFTAAESFTLVRREAPVGTCSTAQLTAFREMLPLLFTHWALNLQDESLQRRSKSHLVLRIIDKKERQLLQKREEVGYYTGHQTVPWSLDVIMSTAFLCWSNDCLRVHPRAYVIGHLDLSWPAIQGNAGVSSDTSSKYERRGSPENYAHTSKKEEEENGTCRVHGRCRRGKHRLHKG